MKKIPYVIFLIMIFTSICGAQSLESGIGVSLNTPAGNFSDVAKNGYGGAFMVKLGVPIIDITGSVEYISFGEKDIAGIKYNASAWGINAGARISVFPFISAGAELGNYWLTVSADNGTNKADNTENKVAFTPLLAANIGMFEGSVRYAIISNASFISIRAGIYF